jgi:glycine cleavage system transcriptional repressor
VSKTVVLAAVGRDRVGIVAEVSELLYKLGCNLLDSSMTLLRGEFAIILMVELPEGQSVNELERSLSAIEEKLGLTLRVRELSADEIEESTSAGTMHMISVYGADRPGIVAGITRRLADLGVNITDVETKSTGEGREHVFVMLLEVSVPADLSTSGLAAVLTEEARRLGVDVSVRDLEVYEL